MAQLWKDADDKGVFNRILSTPDPFSQQDLAELRQEMKRSWLFPGVLERLDADNAWHHWNRIHWGTKWDVGESGNAGGSRPNRRGAW